MLHRMVVAVQNDVFALFPLVPGCSVRDVDRREVVQLPTIIFCPSMDARYFFVILPSKMESWLFFLAPLWASRAFH